MKPTKRASQGMGFVMISMLFLVGLCAVVAGVFSLSLEPVIQILFGVGFFVAIFTFLGTLLFGVPVFLVLEYFYFAKPSVLILAGTPACSLVGVWLFPYGDQLIIAMVFGLIGLYCSPYLLVRS